MGFSQSHRCTSCGLAATVSAGDDIGFYAKTQTRYCEKCNTLVDVCVELWCKDLLPGLLSEDRVNELLALENKLGCCPHCDTPSRIVWCFSDPCPRCGGVIEKTNDELINWD